MITISMDHDDHQADLGDELINTLFTDSTTKGRRPRSSNDATNTNISKVVTYVASDYAPLCH